MGERSSWGMPSSVAVVGFSAMAGSNSKLKKRTHFNHSPAIPDADTPTNYVISNKTKKREGSGER